MITREYRPQAFDQIAGQNLNKRLLKAIIENPERSPRVLILEGQFGTGKCVLPDTRVAVSQGYKKIVDLVSCANEGFTSYVNQVDTREGVCNSSHFYKQSKCRVNLLTLENNEVINGTDKHRVLAYHDGRIDLFRTAILSVGEYVLFPRKPLDWIGSIHCPDRAFIFGSGLRRNYSDSFPEEVYEYDYESRCKFIEGYSNGETLSYKDFSGELTPVLLGVRNILHTLGVTLTPEQNIPFEQDSNYTYVKIVDKSETISDVYDLTVPDIHEFYAQGTYNHNTSSARIFARALNCQGRNKPCGVCPVCQEDLEYSSFYAEYDSAVIGNVDKIRELRDYFLYTISGRYKVIVLDEVHLASKEAQSALLKVFEDIPEKVFFILCTTDVDKILPTIRSRSLELHFELVSHNDIMDNLKGVCELKGISADDESLSLIAEKSGGHMRNAHMLLDQFLLVGKEEFFSNAYSCREYLISYFKAVALRDKGLLNASVDKVCSCVLADVKDNFQSIVLAITKGYVLGTDNADIQEIIKSFGNQLMKLIKFCTSSWVSESFSSDLTMQSMLLCLYQLMETKEASQNKDIYSRAMRR